MTEHPDSTQARPTEPPDGRSLGEILARNTFTWLNFILVVLGVATLATGSAPDATFLLIALINSVVGAYQEVRAKRTLDSLRVVNAPRARVRRGDATAEVAMDDLVVGDLVELRVGDQIGADAVVEAERAEVDESLVTGESDAVTKGPGDELVSGTWLVGGSLVARITAVGADSYASRLASEARAFSLTGSELVDAVNRILRWLSLIMVAIAPVLLWRQLQVQDWRHAVQATTAGLVGMVPEGLVLLTTLAFFTAAVRLSRRRVLVQELPAVESLARVDELCTDKTGTLTQGRITWGSLVLPPSTAALGGVPLPGAEEIEAALAALGDDQEANATLAAIREAVTLQPGWEPTASVGFNSARKWSGTTFAGRGTWVLGAPEMVTAADPGQVLGEVARLASAGRRVLVVAHGEMPFGDGDGDRDGDSDGNGEGDGSGDALPADLRLVAAVELREQLRPDASATLAYFAAQGVTVRVVSGDSAPTVGAVAAEVGLAGAEDPVDARAWPEPGPELDQLIANHTVFGRVKPDQKRILVDSLRRGGHVIAMTGDGVNDTLALKDADLGIAMGSGSPVARGVAQLVLLDDQFEVLPYVVAQGRQVLHNIERAAELFLVKNVYSFVISVVVAIAGWPYPFLPRHLSLVSAVGIGIPGFFLALGPSDERFRPGFLRRVLRFSVPAGMIAAAAVLLTYAIARDESTDPARARTAAVIVVMVVSLWVLVHAAQPWRAWKLGLIAGMGVLFALCFVVPGVDTFFNLEHRPRADIVVEAVAFAVVASGVAWYVTAQLERRTTPR